MSEKIELKEKLAAVDLNLKNLWGEIDDDQRKNLKQEFFILNRYISNVSSSKRELQEHFVLTVNEYFNKHWNTLQKHPKLMWQLLCMCSHESRQIFFHQWIGFKRKEKESGNKIYKFLLEIYPNRKSDELLLMTQLITFKEARDLAERYGYDQKQIDKLFK